MARLLLDTNALIWIVENNARLGRAARAAADRAAAAGDLHTSAYSFLEIANLQSKGKVRFTVSPSRFRDDVLALGIREIAMTGEVALRSADFLSLGGDPGDRVILACAAVERCTLLTSDVRLLAWRGSLPRMDARR